MNKILPLFGTAASLIIFLSACSYLPRTAEQMSSYVEAYQQYQAGQKALHDKNFDLADRACVKGLELLGKTDSPLTVCLLAVGSESKLEQADYAAGIKYLDQALPLISKYEGRNSRSYVYAMTRKASANFYQGKFAEAEPLYYEAEALYDRLGALQSKDESVRYSYERVLGGLFATLAANGNDIEACSAGKRLLIAMDSDEEPTEFNLRMTLADVLANDGEMLYGKGKKNLARPFFEKSIRIYKQYMNQGPNPEGKKATYVPTASIITGMTHLGEIYEKSGRAREGRLLKKEAYSWSCVVKRLHEE